MIFGLTLSLQENYYAEVRCVAIIIIAYRTRLLSHLRNRRNLRMVLLLTADYSLGTSSVVVSRRFLCAKPRTK